MSVAVLRNAPDLNVILGSVTAVQGVTIPSETSTGTQSLNFTCNDTNGHVYQWYATNTTAGGLLAGSLELFDTTYHILNITGATGGSTPGFSSYVPTLVALNSNNAFGVIGSSNTIATFNVVTASSTGTGVQVSGAAAGSGAFITANSSNSNENLYVQPKGTAAKVGITGLSGPAGLGPANQITTSTLMSVSQSGGVYAVGNGAAITLPVATGGEIYRFFFTQSINALVTIGATTVGASYGTVMGYNDGTTLKPYAPGTGNCTTLTLTGSAHSGTVGDYIEAYGNAAGGYVFTGVTTAVPSYT